MSYGASGEPIIDALLANPQMAESMLGAGPAREQTGLAVRSFVAGVRVWDPDPALVMAGLEVLTPRVRLFAWEGVGLMAALQGSADGLYALAPAWSSLMSVGVGWAAALRRGLPQSLPSRAEETWAILDGYGFCSGLLERRNALASLGIRSDRRASSHREVAVDQGLGRSLYFVHGGTPASISRVIDGAQSQRRPALWGGVGIASVVTDGLEAAQHRQLRELGGDALRHGELVGELLLARVGVRTMDPELRDIGGRLRPDEPPLLGVRRALER